MNNRNCNYNTLEDLQAKKDELNVKIRQSNETIAKLWSDLFVAKKANTKGEFITSIISKSITAFDAFMLVRKLMMQYGHFFGKKRSSRR